MNIFNFNTKMTLNFQAQSTDLDLIKTFIFFLGVYDVKIVREFAPDKMIMTIYVDDRIAKRYYKSKQFFVI